MVCYQRYDTDVRKISDSQTFLKTTTKRLEAKKRLKFVLNKIKLPQ